MGGHTCIFTRVKQLCALSATHSSCLRWLWLILTINFLLWSRAPRFPPDVRACGMHAWRGGRRWYFVALTHEAPRKRWAPSEAALYVDGKLVQTLKAEYPSFATPPDACRLGAAPAGPWGARKGTHAHVRSCAWWG
jgi:hypothetical protein